MTKIDKITVIPDGGYISFKRGNNFITYSFIQISEYSIGRLKEILYRWNLLGKIRRRNRLGINEYYIVHPPQYIAEILKQLNKDFDMHYHTELDEYQWCDVFTLNGIHIKLDRVEDNLSKEDIDTLLHSIRELYSVLNIQKGT